MLIFWVFKCFLSIVERKILKIYNAATSAKFYNIAHDSRKSFNFHLFVLLSFCFCYCYLPLSFFTYYFSLSPCFSGANNINSLQNSKIRNKPQVLNCVRLLQNLNYILIENWKSFGDYGIKQRFPTSRRVISC